MKSISYIYKINITIVSFWKKNLPLFIRKGIASSNFTIITLIVITFSIGYLIVYESKAPYLTFGIENQEAKGKMLATYLSICGGITVLYGLYLNHKKLNEQTRQNDLEFKFNNDKRFGEAIGYLNSDNIGIAIGGVYTLYQLAKEDERYTSIVANIFVEILPHLTNFCENKIYDIIIEKLFSETFDKIEITFKNLSFVNLELQTATSIKFERCSLNKIEINNSRNLTFNKCTLNNVLLNNINNLTIEKCDIGELVLQNMYSINGLILCQNKIKQCTINCDDLLECAFLEENTISSFLEIRAKYLNDVTISNDYKIKICSKTPENIIIKRNNNKEHKLISYGTYDHMRIYYKKS